MKIKPFILEFLEGLVHNLKNIILLKAIIYRKRDKAF